MSVLGKWLVEPKEGWVVFIMCFVAVTFWTPFIQYVNTSNIMTVIPIWCDLPVCIIKVDEMFQHNTDVKHPPCSSLLLSPFQLSRHAMRTTSHNSWNKWVIGLFNLHRQMTYLDCIFAHRVGCGMLMLALYQLCGVVIMKSQMITAFTAFVGSKMPEEDWENKRLTESEEEEYEQKQGQRWE